MSEKIDSRFDSGILTYLTTIVKARIASAILTGCVIMTHTTHRKSVMAARLVRILSCSAAWHGIALRSVCTPIVHDVVDGNWFSLVADLASIGSRMMGDTDAR